MASMIIIFDIKVPLGMSFYHGKVQFSSLQGNNAGGSMGSLRSLPSPELYLIIFFKTIEKKETTQAEKRDLSRLQSGSVTLPSVSHSPTDKEWGE